MKLKLLLPLIAALALFALPASAQVTAAQLTAGCVTMPKIAQSGATSGQFLEWSGSAWQPFSLLTGTAYIAPMSVSGTAVTSTTGGVHYFTGSSSGGLTLPSPSACTGYIYTFVDGGSGTPVFVISPHATESINGPPTLNYTNESWSYVSDGTNWWVVGQGAPSNSGFGITITDGSAVTSASGAVATGSSSVCGIITYTSAATGSVGTICSVVFTSGLGSQPAVTITPTTIDSAKAGFYISTETTSGFTVSNAYAAASSVPLGFTYTVNQL